MYLQTAINEEMAGPGIVLELAEIGKAVVRRHKRLAMDCPATINNSLTKTRQAKISYPPSPASLCDHGTDKRRLR